MRGAATKAMSDIVDERQQSRYAPFAAAPLGLRPAGQQQSVHIISSQTPSLNSERKRANSNVGVL